MSTPSLSGLANEIVVQIFKSLPNCRAVAALNCTSRKYYQTWQSNAAAISDAVLPRNLDCYAGAEELVRFQTAQGRASAIEELGTDEADDAYHQCLERNKLFSANDSMVSKESTALQVDAIREHCRNISGSFLAEGLRRHLKRIRYHFHCVAALFFDRAAQDEYLEGISLNDLKLMQRDITWSNPRHYYTDFEYFRIYTKISSARDPFDLIEEAYLEKRRRK